MIRHVVRAIPGALVALSALTGIALWVTFGSFDLLFPNNTVLRAAMLPPWWALGASIVAAFLTLAAIVWITSKSGARRLAATTTAARHITELDPRAVRHVILPCAALVLLLLPYLPWLADRLPILWLLAGPGRVLVWIVVAWLVARGVWLLGGAMPLWLTRRERRGAIAVFVVTAIMSGAVAHAFKRSTMFPGGDEPHYLVMAQSLWRDHDLKIENNHKRGDYHEYFEGQLTPHYLVRGIDREIYSVHPVGMPVLIAPIYALGGYDLVVWTFVGISSLAAAILWLITRRATDDAGAATAAWAACCLNGVWAFNSISVYPEIPAALAAIAGFALVQRPLGSTRGAWRRWLGAGLVLSTLPWLSTKYAPMSAMLVLVALGRVWLPPQREAQDAKPLETAAAQKTSAGAMVLASLAVIVPYAISLVGWFAFFYAIWGTPWPSAPYGTQHETGLRFLLSGGPGLLFDQEYGLIAFVPALLVSLVGLVAMWRAGGSARRLAVEVAVPFVALLVTVGAFHIWWGGSAVAGRPIISGLLLLGIPFAWRYQQQRDKHAILGAYHLLMAIGFAIGLTLAFAQNGLLIAAGRNGVSQLLSWLSPNWSLWELAPAFITQTPIIAALVTIVWVAIACVAGWWLRGRPQTWTPGSAMLVAALTCTLSVLVVSIVLPVTIGRWAGRPEVVPIAMRSHLLDEFDTARRPIAVVFDPIRRVDPQSLPLLVEFVAQPDDKRPKQPIPLLYNARFALPAGRYAVELVSKANTPVHELKGTLSLQLGRIGAPAREWDVDIAIPGIWGRAFDLPIDVNLVGFHGSPEVEQARPSLRIRPISVVDAHERVPVDEVLSARMSARAMVFFHDEKAMPEGTGFWTPGRSSLTVTVAAQHEKPPRISVRAGPVPTSVKLITENWRQDIELEPGAQRVLDLPMPANDLTRLTIETRTGFVPARADSASHDERLLGCWVEVD